MDAFLLLSIIASVVGGELLAWSFTKRGKKWLGNL